ncbi:MAG: hypothetical protein GY914_06755 [Prochlorococcus sp.]|nr:hypothetical protein [Prochlorococcus sp.]
MANLIFCGVDSAASQLGVSKSWLRAAKSSGELAAGDHWVFSTGKPRSRVLWNVEAIRQWQVSKTKLHAENQHQLAEDIEIYVEINNA